VVEPQKRKKNVLAEGGKKKRSRYCRVGEGRAVRVCKGSDHGIEIEGKGGFNRVGGGGCLGRKSFIWIDKKRGIAQEGTAEHSGPQGKGRQGNIWRWEEEKKQGQGMRGQKKKKRRTDRIEREIQPLGAQAKKKGRGGVAQPETKNGALPPPPPGKEKKKGGPPRAKRGKIKNQKKGE